MKLAIVTDQKLHHKYFITSLYEKYDVRVIIHPTGEKIPLAKKLEQKKFFSYGVFWFLLKLRSLIYHKFNKKSYSRQLNEQEIVFFGGVQEKYDAIPKNIITKVETVNSVKAIDIVKSAEVDIICFLGGDIAKKEFISSAKVCSLNFHSGISPYYNGNKTVFHAVKDSRPNFVGGTLMYINERIDGGGILSHFLPEINDTDTAATLFLKGIMGTVKLYCHFLDYITNHELPEGITQERSFKYVRNIDWTYADDILLRKFEESGKMRIYSREELVLTYYEYSKTDIDKIYQIPLKFILSKSR